LKFNYHALI